MIDLFMHSRSYREVIGHFKLALLLSSHLFIYLNDYGILTHVILQAPDICQ